MKDRVARNIVTDAERRGLLGPGGTIVEATSGNTGMGLALVAALRGYSCVFVMPDKMSPEKVAGLRAFGARVVICPTAVEPEDPRSYYQTAKRIVAETPGAFYANQYHNPANPDAHYSSTAPEIWDADQRRGRRLRCRHGDRRDDLGLRALLQGEEARLPPGGRRSDRLALLRVREDRADDPAVRLLRRGDRRGLPAEHDEPQAGRRDRARRRQGVLPDDARAGAPGGALRRAAARARRWRAPSSTPRRRSARRTSWCCSPTARPSTCRRSSTTSGCARTASSTSPIRWGRSPSSCAARSSARSSPPRRGSRSAT